MSKSKITGHDLIRIGFFEGKSIGLALIAIDTYKGKSKTNKLEILARVVKNPSFYIGHKNLGPLAQSIIDQKQETTQTKLSPVVKSYKVYGRPYIEIGAINQMDQAMKLPVSIAGALMADAHYGYGLPIGGVLATKDAIIPYGVGVDIGCRMSLSIYDISPTLLEKKTYDLQKMLIDNTKFGKAVFERPLEHPIMDRIEFQSERLLKSLKDTAYRQLGSSGGGNHFVELGIVTITEADQQINVPKGNYLGVLSHSGSRGMGAKVAEHYTQLAKKICSLPKEVVHLAWLDTLSQEGQEYWNAMNLAGDYASACHHQIHKRFSIALGENPIAKVENHHNFAWKEIGPNGEELIVHRKGATPARKGVLGIIPGSMTAPGFIVRGKGHPPSLSSASHGAGRVMSRSKAKTELSKKDVAKYIKDSGVTLIGAGLDEAPMAYKNINEVMNQQKELVDVIGSFTPKIVRMCGDEKMLGIDS